MIAIAFIAIGVMAFRIHRRNKAEEEAALAASRVIAEEQAAAEATRKAAEEQAALEASRKAAEEEAALEASRKAAEEEAALEASRKAAEEEAALQARSRRRRPKLPKYRVSTPAMTLRRMRTRRMFRTTLTAHMR